jgi:hypothetical protein
VAGAVPPKLGNAASAAGESGGVYATLTAPPDSPLRRSRTAAAFDRSPNCELLQSAKRLPVIVAEAAGFEPARGLSPQPA